MQEEIRAGLEEIERANGVRVLYACESGSRAWGFASPDSDYDVRFLYSYPRDRYLSIEEPKETIEFITSNDLDYAGWDLRKALRLLRKSNPSLIEWLDSPVVYRDSDGFLAELKGLSAQFVDLARLDYHYASMARANFNAYLLREEVSRKKYLYVLRPLFCRRWIGRFRSAPPVLFPSLLDAVVTDQERPAIDRLLTEKALSPEMAVGPRDPDLHRIVEAEIESPANQEGETGSGERGDVLDRFFRRWLA